MILERNTSIEGRSPALGLEGCGDGWIRLGDMAAAAETDSSPRKGQAAAGGRFEAGTPRAGLIGRNLGSSAGSRATRDAAALAERDRRRERPVGRAARSMPRADGSSRATRGVADTPA